MNRLAQSRFAAAMALAVASLAWSTTAVAQGPLEAFERAQQNLYERVAPAVVHITGKGGTGTGFFVDSEGLILTNEHVVRGAKSVEVITLDGAKHRGSVVATGGKEVDLALLKVSMKNQPKPLKLADLRDLRVGSWVGAVGHGWGGVWAYTTGIVSNVYPSGDARPIFQTQIPLNPGNSGGPVFDRQGRVVGIVTWGIERANNINFAITSEVAMFTFPQIPVTCDCLIVTAPDGVPIFVDGKMAGKGPGLLLQTRPGARHEIFVVKDGKMDKRKVQFPNLRRVAF